MILKLQRLRLETVLSLERNKTISQGNRKILTQLYDGGDDIYYFNYPR